MNKVYLTGRLAADPEMRYTAQGKAVTSTRLAVDDGVDSEGKRKSVFINVTWWGGKDGKDGNAEHVANHFKKGDQIIVEGRLTVLKRETDEGNRYELKVNGDRWEFAAKAREKEAAPA